MMINNLKGIYDLFSAEANCILCLKIPDRENSNYDRIITLKEQIFKDKINNNDFNFTGANLLKFNLQTERIDGDLKLNKTIILGNVLLNNVIVVGKVNLDYSKIGGEVNITNKSEIKNLHMDRTFVNDRININNSSVNTFTADGDYESDIPSNILSKVILKIEKHIPSLNELKRGLNSINREYGVRNSIDITNSNLINIFIHRFNIGESEQYAVMMDSLSIYEVQFINCDINGTILFNNVEIGGDCTFKESKIKSGFIFKLSKIKGELNFSKVEFDIPNAQKRASREAKRIWDKLGDKEKADQYYYSEMVAKRKEEKNKIFRYTEWLFIQLPFGYGVKFYNVIFTFIFVILFFALIFWLGDGIKGADSLISNFYASTLIASKIGYNGYQPVNVTYELLTAFEAIIGTVLWSITIVIFAKKFIR